MSSTSASSQESVTKKPSAAPPGPPPTSPKPAVTAPKTAPVGAPREPRVLQLNGHVGFDSLPQQLVQKCISEGFTFNILCVGETGIGKTTLMESLFNMSLDFAPCNYEQQSVELRSKTYDIEEGGVHLKLTIVETAGFGDQLDKENSSRVIVDYIDEQFEKYLKEELKIRRLLQAYHDTRIHACLYFISPTGHGLKALDVVTMKALATKANVIPVIAKADTTSKDELKKFKSKILVELKAQGIEIYRFPEDDDMEREQNALLNADLPFAVVGSTSFVKNRQGKSVRAREYAWGIVEVENEAHCDFVKLREALLRVNVEALRERTDHVLYETYRRERLRQMGISDADAGPAMATAYQQKYDAHLADLKAREAEMKDAFYARVSAKEKELQEHEQSLTARYQQQKERFDAEMAQLGSELKHAEDELHFLENKKFQLEHSGKKAKK